MEPKVAQNKPYVMDAEPGEYWWCACGHSKGQPFCDGS
ncbi:MAG: CDGSH iron-sulfur domain-containing protein, partial [bacterium]